MKNVNKILDKLEEIYPDAQCELNYETPFELLIATILSAQCTDVRVNKVTEILFKKYNTPEQFAALTEEEIGEEIRIKGREFGTVTGRSRRCGWFDAVIVRYAARVNGLTSISLMLLDVLTGFDKIQVCTAYKMGDKIIKDFPASLEDLAKCEPIYEELEGWTEDITSVERFEDLPENAKKYVAKIEELIGVSVDMVSVGPNRAQTIVRRNVF